MNRKSDILVVGSGMAGMTAALAAAASGKSVTLLCYGVGSLAISSACIDVLGYLDGERVNDPFSAVEKLPAEHPYRKIGKENVLAALQWFQDFCAGAGIDMHGPEEGKGNRELVTVMGTTKPSYLCPNSHDAACLRSAKRVAVFSVENMKDVHPKLIIEQLKQYPSLAQKEFRDFVLPCPVKNVHRNITPLDIARYVEKPEGMRWLKENLEACAGTFDVLLLPPICGMEHAKDVWKTLCDDLKVRLVEMISIPPAVSGLRLYDAMRKALVAKGVSMAENVHILRAEVEEGRCKALHSEENRQWEAKEFVIATGGHLGGGLSTEPGKAWESIFNIPLNVPTDIEAWSSPDVFGSSLFARMGVSVGNDLRPLDSEGRVLLQNVRFAGRILGGYDFPLEKSGHGVALATGWLAGALAGKE